MPERKSHVKSRHGCSQCKARRVKCDEIRPTCSNCKRRQESCSYKIAKQVTSPSPHSPAGSEQAGSISTSLHLKQLELMHQWSTSTCFTLAMRSTGTNRHQMEVPRLALEHECLLDTVFALTSLHLASLRPDDATAYIAEAMRYQARAFASTRQKLENLTARECEALYHASGQLGAIALAFRSVDPEVAQHTKPTETLLQLCQLWKGTQLILETSQCLVDPETFSTFLPTIDWNRRRPSILAGQTQVFLDRLKDRVQAGDFDGWDSEPSLSEEATKSAFLIAIDQLQSTFVADDPDFSRIIAWLVLCPDAFIKCLTHGEPLASTLALLYTLLMTDFDRVWWMKDIRQQLVDELSPIVAVADPELAEIADYVQGWTKPASELTPLAPPYDTGVTEIANWIERSHSIQEHNAFSGLDHYR